jgi:hypothetical protein
VQAIPATLDSGYYSEAATQALEALGFEPSGVKVCHIV